MKKNRRGSGESSGLDVLGPLQDIIRQAREGKITGEQLQKFAEHKNPFEKAKSAATGVIRLAVDYTQPLSDMIKACGFGWVNSDTTEKRFPINQRPNGEVEMKVFTTRELVGETRDVTSEEVIQALKNKGYREAELPEGLAYAKANPDEQRNYPIVILGSIGQYWLDRGVSYLDSVYGERDLNLDWFDGKWGSYYRFLAVRKS